MRRRSRLLRVAKWGGVVVCAVLMATWAVSTRWVVAYHGSHRSSAVMNGEFVAFWLAEEKVPRWWFNRLDDAHSTYGFTLPSYVRSAVLLDDKTTPRSTKFSVPIWMPLVLSVGLTTYIIWIDRPPKPGHCPCGYNLTGNVSGVCPECGRSDGTSPPPSDEGVVTRIPRIADLRGESPSECDGE